MKYKAFLTCMAVIFLAEISVLIWFMNTDGNDLQDAVEINAAVQSVQADWGNIYAHRNSTSLDYTVIDGDGKMLFRTKVGLSESINEAVINRDTILDIEEAGKTVGKIIIRNNSRKGLAESRKPFL